MESNPSRSVIDIFLVLSIGVFSLETILLVNELIELNQIMVESDRLLRMTNPRLYELYRPAREES